VRGNERESLSSKGLDFILRWVDRYWLSTDNEQRQYRSADYFYSNDRGTGADANYVTSEEFTYRVAVIFTSAGTFGVGVGQCLSKLISG